MNKIPFTTCRSGIFYVQFWLSRKLIKSSLQTDSYKQARLMMVRITPLIYDVRSEKLTVAVFGMKIEEIVQQYKFSLTKLLVDATEKPLHADSILCDPKVLNKPIAQNYLNDIKDYTRNRFARASSLTSAVQTLSNDTEGSTALPWTSNKHFFSLYISDILGIDATKFSDTEIDILIKQLSETYHQFDLDFKRFILATYQDDHITIDSIASKVNTQYQTLLAKINPAVATASEQSTIVEPLIPHSLSELHERFISEKRRIYLLENKLKKKSNTLTKEQLKVLSRQNKYYMKFRAVAGDYPILTTSKDTIFEALIKLFSWPNERQTNSPYTLEKNKDQAWHDAVADDLDDIETDETIEKAVGTVREIFKYLQELYKFAKVDKKYPYESPVYYKTAEYSLREKLATMKRGCCEKEEVQKLLKFVVETDHMIKWPLILMCFTACRNSELYRIKRSDVDFENMKFKIDGRKTAAAKRDIPLSKRLLDFGFRSFVEQFANDDYILSTTCREEILNQQFRLIIEQLNIHEVRTNDQGIEEYLSFYSLRQTVRTHATFSVNDDLIEVFIGHKLKGTAHVSAYRNAAELAKKVELMRPIVDQLPW